MAQHVHRHSDAIRKGVAVPPWEGFRFEEALFRRLYAKAAKCAQSSDMRVFTDVDIDRMHKLKRLVGIKPGVSVFPSVEDTAILYCLTAGRFPWACLGREISLLHSARLAMRFAAKSRWRRFRVSTR